MVCMQIDGHTYEKITSPTQGKGFVQKVAGSYFPGNAQLKKLAANKVALITLKSIPIAMIASGIRLFPFISNGKQMSAESNAA